MIVCTNCGHENPDDATFCASCNAFLEWSGARAQDPSKAADASSAVPDPDPIAAEPDPPAPEVAAPDQPSPAPPAPAVEPPPAATHDDRPVPSGTTSAGKPADKAAVETQPAPATVPPRPAPPSLLRRPGRPRRHHHRPRCPWSRPCAPRLPRARATPAVPRARPRSRPVPLARRRGPRRRRPVPPVPPRSPAGLPARTAARPTTRAGSIACTAARSSMRPRLPRRHHLRRAAGRCPSRRSSLERWSSSWPAWPCSRSGAARPPHPLDRRQPRRRAWRSWRRPRAQRRSPRAALCRWPARLPCRSQIGRSPTRERRRSSWSRRPAAHRPS